MVKKTGRGGAEGPRLPLRFHETPRESPGSACPHGGNAGNVASAAGRGDSPRYSHFGPGRRRKVPRFGKILAEITNGAGNVIEDSTDNQSSCHSPVDLAVFAEMVRRHQDFVYGAVLRVVRNPILAEDLSQETFIRAFKGLDDFRGDAQLRTWLYRIGTNLALNAVTRQRESPTDELPDTAHAPGPETDVERAHLRRHMAEMIDLLPETLRRPLIMREYEGMSYQDIADDLELPLNTVRTRILRARRALRQELEPWR